MKVMRKSPYLVSVDLSLNSFTASMTTQVLEALSKSPSIGGEGSTLKKVNLWESANFKEL